MKRIVCLLTLMNYCLVFSQTSVKNRIVGMVYQKNTDPKIPIKNALVNIPGIGNAVTDNTGAFFIGLSQCLNCTPGKTLKIYVNSDYGYGENEYVIPIDPNLKSCEIAVSPNQKLSLNGFVIDKRTGAFLKGIRVKAIIQNAISAAPVITDQDGSFNLVIRKDGIPNLQAIQLLFSDSDNKYRALEKVVFISQLAPIKAELEICDNCGIKRSISVSRNFTSDICVEKGDLVKIIAGGQIRVGNWVGLSGPEGVARGVGGINLDRFNYFQNWNHAVLYFRVGDQDEWKCYELNKENSFIASHNGCLQFGVNDNDQGNNSGAYNVTVIIAK